MTVLLKQGVVGDLSNKAQKCLGRVDALYTGIYKEDLVVTSIRDGNHGSGSLHFIGDAFDIRYPQDYKAPQLLEDILLEDIKMACGRGFDVVLEGSHIHIEYDPKY